MWPSKLQRMKKRTLLAAIVTINSYTGFCQNIAGNIVAGVASGTLVSGTNLVNVDLYTGIGTVSIPIYKYSVDNVGFDISLTYNAKGITVNELASSVGLG